jgi:hypothetical protein
MAVKEHAFQVSGSFLPTVKSKASHRLNASYNYRKGPVQFAPGLFLWSPRSSRDLGFAKPPAARHENLLQETMRWQDSGAIL